MKKLIGLTLFNALKQIKCNVKVGADNGSGYVYCGKPNAKKLHEAEIACAEADERRTVQARKKLDQLIAEMADLQRRIDAAASDLYSKEDCRLNRTHLLKRKVTDICKSIDEPRTLLVRFEGDEKGAYWTTAECQSNKTVIDDEEEI